MSLRDEITADIAEAFDTDLADAVSSFTGSRVVPDGPPDPINQTQPTITITYTGRGVFGSYETEVSEALGILRTDVKLTALQAEVTGQPKIDDEIQETDPQTGELIGPVYRVVHVGQDAAGVSWTIQIRRV